MDKLFSGNWPRLLRRDISTNTLTYRCAELSEEPAWPLLSHLHMGGCCLDFEPGALLQVVKIKWSHLQFIDMRDNPLHFEGVHALINAP